MDNDTNESMLDVYLFEANTLLEQLDEILISCEKQGMFDQDSINEIFRIMHTIKGSSAMMEFNSLMVVSHKAEDLFAYVREHGIQPEHTDELFDLMFRSSDFLKAEIELVQKNEPLTDHIGSFEANVNSFLKKISDAPDEPANEEAASSASAASLRSTPTEAGYTVKVYFDEDAQMENLRALMLVTALQDAYPELEYSPTALQDGDGVADEIAQNGFLLFFRSEKDFQECQKILENFIYIKQFETVDQAPRKPLALPGADELEQASPMAAAPASADNPRLSHPSTSLISVNLMKLDSLMDLMGEIVVTESMVTSIPTTQGTDMDNFTKASRELRKLTDELQEIVMSIRMVPVSGVFQKMNRIVRDMSKKLGKNVDLLLEGEDTEVDKTIVDNIADPLMHLVRNAMDHGIESEETRLAAGKPAKGRITLSAKNTSGEILICVRDDGAGFDRAAILRKAKKQGMLKKAENDYTTKEIFGFLLQPGFSTNEAVTEFSGRGVGMDVVKKNIEKSSGSISLDSEPGKGSSVLIKIPLTLAIVNGMLLAVGDSVFTIPISNIRQSVKIDETSVIHDTEMREIVMIRNEYYPLIRLHKVYEIEKASTDLADGIVILIESGEKTYCVFADSLLGEQQVVIKPIPKYLNRYDLKEFGITGCAILGNGDISLILDIAGLASN